MELVLVRRLNKLGNKYCITIPRKLVERGELKHGELYIISIKKI